MGGRISINENLSISQDKHMFEDKGVQWVLHISAVICNPEETEKKKKSWISKAVVAFKSLNKVQLLKIYKILKLWFFELDAIFTLAYGNKD